jgi:hypothetical protein
LAAEANNQTPAHCLEYTREVFNLGCMGKLARSVRVTPEVALVVSTFQIESAKQGDDL